MTTTTLKAYAEENDLRKLTKELLDNDSPIYIVDFRRTSEGFPYEILIGFEGEAKQMRKAKAFIEKKIEPLQCQQSKYR